jgi:hypothetical protein
VLPPSCSDVAESELEEVGTAEKGREKKRRRKQEGQLEKGGAQSHKKRPESTTSDRADTTSRRVTLMIGWWAHQPGMSAQKERAVSGRAFCSLPAVSSGALWPTTMPLVKDPPPPIPGSQVDAFPQIPVAVLKEPWARIPAECEVSEEESEEDDDGESESSDDGMHGGRPVAAKLPVSSDRFFFIRSPEDMNEKLVAVTKKYDEEVFDDEDDVDLFGDLMAGDY